MEYFPSVLSREESDQLAFRIKVKLEEQGWGLWVATLVESDRSIGFIGLNEVTFSAPFTPAVEVGWRLAYDYWVKGMRLKGLWRLYALALKRSTCPKLSLLPLSKIRVPEMS